MSFDHEQLKVYQRAIAFCGDVDPLIQGWDTRHAITDHLPRAAESIVMNLAEACATFSKARISTLDYSLGSVLECAACLDIAAIKGLVGETSAIQKKNDLVEVFRMLMGLRSAWSKRMVREESARYGSTRQPAIDGSGFHHETLDVYRLSLDVMRRLNGISITPDTPVPLFRKLDTVATSIVLNLAEGNGRFSELDQRRFLAVAYRAAVKLAAQLDLCVQKCAMERQTAELLKRPLVSVANMIAVMRRKERKDA